MRRQNISTEAPETLRAKFEQVTKLVDTYELAMKSWKNRVDVAVIMQANTTDYNTVLTEAIEGAANALLVSGVPCSLIQEDLDQIRSQLESNRARGIAAWQMCKDAAISVNEIAGRSPLDSSAVAQAMASFISKCCDHFIIGMEPAKKLRHQLMARLGELSGKRPPTSKQIAR